MPDVSYLIAAHDSARTVEAAVRSALAQTGVSVEVVMIDDASSDTTLEVVRSIDDPRIQVVELRQNLGPGGARNAGLDVATGTWVAVLDSDDEIASDRTVRMLDRARNADADVVVDNIEHVDHATGRRQPMYSTALFESPSRLSLADFIDGNVMLDRSLPYAYGYLQPLFRRSLVEDPRLRYPEGLRIGEDFYFFAHLLLRAGYAATEPVAGYRYLTRGDSISSRLRLENVLLMQSGDEAFRREHDLDVQTEAALRRRTRSLDEAAAFLRLTDSVRDRSWPQAARIVVEQPRVVRHLRLPVQAKLRRFGRRLRSLTAHT